MEFVKNNRALFVLAIVIGGIFAMAAAIGYDVRAGQPWYFAK